MTYQVNDQMAYEVNDQNETAQRDLPEPAQTGDYPYTETDQTTWRRFFAAIEAVWARHGAMIHPYYMQNIQHLDAFREHIPSLAEVNALLAPVGWRTIYVDGLAPPWEIARLLEQRIMPISRSIRPPEEVYFATGPDLIHDIFGHLPLLLSGEYRDLLANWSQTASRLPIGETDKASYHLNKLIVQSQDQIADATLAHLKGASTSLEEFIAKHPSPALIFDKIYFWIFEFGIIEMDGRLQIMGAGLLSSLSEIERIATEPVAMHPLDLRSILSPYNISTQQQGYLVAAGMEQCAAMLTATANGFTLH